MAADAESQQWSGRIRQIYRKIEASERRIAHEIDGVGTQVRVCVCVSVCLCVGVWMCECMTMDL